MQRDLRSNTIEASYANIEAKADDSCGPEVISSSRRRQGTRLIFVSKAVHGYRAGGTAYDAARLLPPKAL